ncbi:MULTISPECIES: FRG domain-containing protein [Sphingobacterium]|uniref:FRG domain-containing protein n=1 Tax=Sphingobacterium TaxID=28453 RepID=UPI000ED2E163|nr:MULTISPECIES: FRG domain-containing protein [Sphingobacterium]HAF34208.1 hypothetical protein [Sphingobacterium sp.]
MKTIRVNNFFEYLTSIENIGKNNTNLILYRGQGVNLPLIPSVARKDPSSDTTEMEVQMLAELKRRSKLIAERNLFDDWEWLVYAQHFGMKTRLLDWSSNPLTALWFACSNEYQITLDASVYILTDANEFILEERLKESPFNRSKTRILKPDLNNNRIVAQSGWFSVHKYSSKAKRFVDLKTNREIKDNLLEVIIPGKQKKDILKNLNTFGINHQSLFPDITGFCKNINWEFNI